MRYYSKKITLFSKYLFCTSLLLTSPSYSSPTDDGDDSRACQKRAAAMVENLRKDNASFVETQPASYFSPFLTGQNPRMTLVTCADSRVHHHAFDKTPDDDIFMVRNLSGQYKSDEASVLYGVNHAKTPLLLVMGHDNCGAVIARTKLKWLEDNKYIQWNGTRYVYSSGEGIPEEYKYLDPINTLEDEIASELQNVVVNSGAIPPKDEHDQEGLKNFANVVHENIKCNVHNQVSACLERFREKVEAGKLIIAGSLYDFQGREDAGQGRLIWIDARDSLYLSDEAQEERNRIQSALNRLKEASISVAWQGYEPPAKRSRQ